MSNNSPRLYFMADAHLGNRHHREPEKARELLYSFWRTIAQPGNCLYILGDLFDFWFEWPGAVPQRHFQTLIELRQLVDAGVEVHLLPGNHDFHFGPFLRERVGLRLHDEPCEFEWAGRRFHVRHGDGLDPDERGYLLLKGVLRNRVSQALYRLIPPAIGMWLADQVSDMSSRRNAAPPADRFDKLDRYANGRLEAGNDFVIMGHIHIPRKNGRFVVLGDWIHQFSYAQFGQDDLQLKEFTDE